MLRTLLLLTLAWSVNPRAQALVVDEAKEERAPVPAKSATADAGAGRIQSLLAAPERSGVILGSQLPARPGLRWTLEAEEGDLGEPLLDDGIIYFGTRVFQPGGRGMLCAVKLEDGSFVWRNLEIGEVSTPVARGDRLYVSSKAGLTALAKANGSIVWNYRLGDDSTEATPLLVKDRIIVADYSGKVSAIDLQGKLLWEHDIAADTPPSPPGFDREKAVMSGKAARPRTSSSDGITVFQPIFDQSRVVAIDLATGKRRWSFQAKGWIYGEPVVSADHVFIGSQDDHFYCLDKKTGVVVWKFKTKSRIEAAGAFHDGSVYFGSCDGRFYRVNVKTGKEVWNYQTPPEKGTHPAIYSAPVCTEDAVYFGSFDGHLYGLKVADGTLKWRIKTADGSEIFSTPLTDGREFVLTTRRNSEKEGRNAIVVVGEAKDD